MTHQLLLLPGDGIGPEVMAEVERVLDVLVARHGLQVSVETALFGGASFDIDGVPISEATISKAKAADGVLMGAVGGPAWANVPRDLRPEMGLLRLRKAMDVYANLRPALCFPALADASGLKRALVEGLDIVFVRELTGGVYFGTPRGIETLPDGTRRGFDNQVYTTDEIVRVARVAFE